jgi:uncharacterized membrane protein
MMPAINIDTKGIGEAVGAVGTLAKDIRAAVTGKAVVDPEAQAALEAKILEIEAQVAQAQAKVNEAEVVRGGFAGNWRPALGWVCVLGLAVKFLVAPGLTYFGLAAPELDTSEMMTLIVGMLGLVGVRTWEKIKGVAR